MTALKLSLQMWWIYVHTFSKKVMSNQKLVFQTGTWAGKHTAPLHKTL